MLESIDSDFFADPHSYYRRWRATGAGAHPVRFPDGVVRWIVTDYANGRATLANPLLRKSFSGALAVIKTKRDETAASDPRAVALLSHMLATDPPEHTRLRKLVTKAFTTRAVAGLRPHIVDIATSLLDDIGDAERVDLIKAFAEPLPITVICELLGVPFEDRAKFQAWTSSILSVVGRDEDARRTSVLEMALYLRNDLLSELTRVTDDGDRLSEQELVAMAFLLLVAGHETTVNLIGNGVTALLRAPGQWDALRADLDRVPAAVESLLRFDGPVNLSTIRYTEEPVTIGNTEIPAGELVFVALPSANHDDAHFTNPDELDLDAPTTGHLAFGHGIHFCVGAPLARLEAQIAFTALLERYPNLRIDPDAAELSYQPSTLIRGLTSLPVLLR
ncbi:cytochrome P450 family protein [Nocardia camponoti]|uniref:Cytochrome P450 n=1 Tax=Nocardia camponoti TaxID=1616106 RepID=A0A917V4X0_9NOCA|nr:cytochrome P450 [Nocardia camponoti]GGK38164.1 cytochrome P450 [Nocardia camponoti]